jgi:hypothetical protein
MTPTPFLKISGNQLVDGSGAPVTAVPCADSAWAAG